MRMPGFQLASAHDHGHLSGEGSGDADDSHAAAALGGSDRDDGFGGGLHVDISG